MVCFCAELPSATHFLARCVITIGACLLSLSAHLANIPTIVHPLDFVGVSVGGGDVGQESVSKCCYDCKCRESHRTKQTIHRSTPFYIFTAHNYSTTTAIPPIPIQPPTFLHKYSFRHPAPHYHRARQHCNHDAHIHNAPAWNNSKNWKIKSVH